MPLSQYKAKGLYKHVGSFELADSKLFEDAVITENLSICTLKKNIVDRYSWTDLVLKSVDQRYIEYYKWNIEHDRNIVIKRADNILFTAPDGLSLDLDFINTTRCSKIGGGGFGPGGYGYKWNVAKTDLNNGRIAFAFSIHFNTKLAKDNFVKWWYYGRKGERLASKVVMGVPFSSIAGNASFLIPQIDWENIHINQKELWDKGDYDNAVLSEMSLKMENGVIVKC